MKILEVDHSSLIAAVQRETMETAARMAHEWCETQKPGCDCGACEIVSYINDRAKQQTQENNDASDQNT